MYGLFSRLFWPGPAFLSILCKLSGLLMNVDFKHHTVKTGKTGNGANSSIMNCGLKQGGPKID